MLLQSQDEPKEGMIEMVKFSYVDGEQEYLCTVRCNSDGQKIMSTIDVVNARMDKSLFKRIVNAIIYNKVVYM